MFRILTFVIILASTLAAQMPKPGGSGAGGGGTVTNIATGCGLSGGPITATGTISTKFTHNNVSAASYTVLDGDCGWFYEFERATAIAVTLPDPEGAGFASGWFFYVRNSGVGTVTFTSTTSTIDDAATLVLTTGQSTVIVSDGVNWITLPGMGSAAGGYTSGATDPATCTPGTTANFFNTTALTMKYCDTTNHWAALYEDLPGAGIGMSKVNGLNTVSFDTAVAPSHNQFQKATSIRCATGGTSTAYTCTLTPALDAYADGAWLVADWHAACAGGSTTMDVNLLGTKRVFKVDGATNPAVNDCRTDVPTVLLYSTALDGGSGGWLMSSLANAPSTTTTNYLTFRAATCQQGAASVNFDLPSTGYPTATCVNSGSLVTGYADFDAAADETVHGFFTVPVNWTSTIDLDIRWRAAAITGNTIWSLQTACVAAGEDATNPTFNAAQTVTDAAAGTTLFDNDAAITSVTTTGCAAGEDLHFKFFRDADNASDTMTGDAQLKWIRFKVQRT